MKTYSIEKENEQVLIESDGRKVLGFYGSDLLINVVRPLFELPITVGCGGAKIDEDGNEIMVDGEMELMPGDPEYIEAVLIERVRNEYGMTIGEKE